jgi:hypothetical protein
VPEWDFVQSAHKIFKSKNPENHALRADFTGFLNKQDDKPGYVIGRSSI